MSDVVNLSIVIPAYNESRRLGPYLDAVCGYFDRRGDLYEVLVVDDGSTDHTADLVTRFSTRCPAVRLIRLTENVGKGAAIRAGMHEARGAHCLFADADGATPIEEVSRLEAAVSSGAHIAIGSRHLACQDARFQVRASLHRTMIGNAFNVVTRLMGVGNIRDTQCGFKLFTRAAARDLFAVSRINGYGFDLELLFVAQLRGYRIAEVPINWFDQPGTKVRLLRDGLRTVGELMAIRRNMAMGQYESGDAPDLTTEFIPTALQK
jgi:dolichyl-phosphate beta-glucosyltransferase